MAEFDPMDFSNENIDNAPQDWQDESQWVTGGGSVPSSTDWNPNADNYFDPSNIGLEQGQYQTNAPADWGAVQMSPSESAAAGFMPTSTNWNPNSGGISSYLSQLFNGMGSKEGKGALTGLGAIVEGMQNKKKSAAVQQMVQQQQQRLDPFGSQRPFYQQQLQSTVQDPYSQPIVASQVAQLQRAQAIKDAQAGRRSNGATSSPALLAAQAQIAQQYMNSLMSPAGASINPNSAGLSELMSSVNSGVNGYMSPIMSALGYNAGTATNSAQMNNSGQSLSLSPQQQANLLQLLQGSK